CTALAVYLILEFYGAVSVGVGDLKEAGNLRQGALSDMSLSTGLNILAYTVSIGAVIALAQFFGSTTLKQRVLWAGVCILCAVGSFVPLSRGSFVALLGASLFVLLRYRRAVANPLTLLVLISVVVVAFALTPRALTQRYASLGSEGTSQEATTG